MSNAKEAYREFLKSAFWLALTAQKKSLVGKCEKCGSRKRLQSHHRVYRDDWYQTTLDDLMVLCRRCHARTHGFSMDEIRSYPGRNSEQNEIFHRCGCLMSKIQKGKRLHKRDKAFLIRASKAYPPTPNDSAVSFHVSNVWRFDRVMNGSIEESNAARKEGLKGRY